MNLRIAHVTATYPPYYGGTGNVCFNNARELAQRGHEVHVFTAAMQGNPAVEISEHVTVHRLRPILRIGNMPVLPGLITVLDGFDIIHLHYPFILGAEMVRLAAAIKKTPLVASFHNDLIGSGTRRRIFEIYQQLSARLTIQSVARLCVVSQDHFDSSRLRRSISGHGVKTVEIPNGVDLDHFHPSVEADHVRKQYGIPSDSKLVLFVAALDRAHHFKGLDNLLLAFQTLPQDTWLLVVGDGDLRTYYEQLAHQSGLASRIIFAGAIRHEDTPPLFRNADVTVLPSSPPESFGLVLIESLACATPVVATRIPGVRTVVDHGKDGYLVPPNDSVALSGAIRTLLEDKTLSQLMGQRGRARVEACYSWKRIGDQLEAVYQQAIEDTRQRGSKP